jgi:signal peptidase complex subunit 2
LLFKSQLLQFKIPIEESEIPKVDKWDWTSVKNALDDSVRKFLTSQSGFTEDHSLMDGRLLLSTLAVLFSAYALLDDWLHPYPQSRTTLIVCVIAYFVSVLILTLYTSYVERGCFGAAKSKLDNKTFTWKLYSKQKP